MGQWAVFKPLLKREVLAYCTTKGWYRVLFQDVAVLFPCVFSPYATYGENICVETPYSKFITFGLKSYSFSLRRMSKGQLYHVVLTPRLLLSSYERESTGIMNRIVLLLQTSAQKLIQPLSTPCTDSVYSCCRRQFSLCQFKIRKQKFYNLF